MDDQQENDNVGEMPEPEAGVAADADLQDDSN